MGFKTGKIRCCLYIGLTFRGSIYLLLSRILFYNAVYCGKWRSMNTKFSGNSLKIFPEEKQRYSCFCTQILCRTFIRWSLSLFECNRRQNIAHCLALLVKFPLCDILHVWYTCNALNKGTLCRMSRRKKKRVSMHTYLPPVMRGIKETSWYDYTTIGISERV